jgi:stage II sporulation protein GA (sporulation sigma-E factor processing peptidase)
MNYVLLLASAKLCGATARRWRMALAAAVGGGYAVASALIPIFGQATGKIAAGVLMALIAFGVRRLARRATTFFAVSASAAGVAMALFGGEARINLGVLAISFAICYAVVSLALRRVGRATAGYCEVTLRLNAREVRVRALRDSGNALRDPATGCDVAVIGLEEVMPLFSLETRKILRTLPQTPAPDVLSALGIRTPRFRLIPYSAVGGGGLLLAFRPDFASVDGLRRELVVAISPNSVADSEAYSALITY